jgi:hypothetical protein
MHYAYKTHKHTILNLSFVFLHSQTNAEDDAEVAAECAQKFKQNFETTEVPYIQVSIYYPLTHDYPCLGLVFAKFLFLMYFLAKITQMRRHEKKK